MLRSALITYVCSILLGTLVAPTAFAAAAAAEGGEALQEIIVTAEKGTQNLQKTAAAGNGATPRQPPHTGGPAPGEGQKTVAAGAGQSAGHKTESATPR